MNKSVYNPKFDYKPVPRVTVDGKRFYATPDGNSLPSVTTILDKTKPEESKRALNEWRKRVGTERAQAITTEAANRGTKMHTYLENYIRTGELGDRGTNPFGWASHDMAKTIIAQGLKNVNEVWGVEIPVYFPKLYAGTMDGAGIHVGQEAVFDYKQSNKPKRREWIDDYFIQLLFYATAHNELHGTNIRKGVILMCVRPSQDAQQNITAAPQYQEFVIEGADWQKYEKFMWARLEQYYSNS